MAINDKYIHSGDVFINQPYGWYNASINNISISEFNTAFIHYSELTPTQHLNFIEVIDSKMQNNALYTDILVVYDCGTYWIINGHHTAIAQIKQGNYYLNIKLYKMPYYNL